MEMIKVFESNKNLVEIKAFYNDNKNEIEFLTINDFNIEGQKVIKLQRGDVIVAEQCVYDDNSRDNVICFWDKDINKVIIFVYTMYENHSESITVKEVFDIKSETYIQSNNMQDRFVEFCKVALEEVYMF